MRSTTGRPRSGPRGEQVHPIGDRLALVLCEPVPPLDELVGDFDLPHRHTMSYSSSRVNAHRHAFRQAAVKGGRRPRERTLDGCVPDAPDHPHNGSPRPPSGADKRHEEWQECYKAAADERATLEVLFHLLATTKLQPSKALVEGLEEQKRQSAQCAMMSIAQTDIIDAAKQGITIEQLFDNRRQAADES